MITNYEYEQILKEVAGTYFRVLSPHSRDWENSWKISYTIAGNLAKTRTGYLQNTSLERSCYIRLLGEILRLL